MRLFGKRNTSPAIAQQAAPSRRPSLQELGGTGLRMSGKTIIEEHNLDLRGPKLYDEYDKMLRADGQAQALELVTCLPIESINWWVEPAAAQEPIDIEIADALNTNLMGGMTCTWGDAISEVVMAPLMGCNFLEMVWEVRNGMTWLRKLSPRHPRTIVEWLQDENGGNQGIVQRVTNPKTMMTQDKPIGIEALLRFTFRGRGGNPEGIGILRAPRTHWLIKHALYNIANVGAENLYNPTAVGQTPNGASKSDEESLLAILRYFGRGIVLPPGYDKPGFMDGGARTANILGLIEHHDVHILRAGLAQFLNLGAGDTGSWALSDSHVNFFLMLQEKNAKRSGEVFDRYLIPKWVGYNFPGVDRFPTMAHTPIAHVLQKAALMQAIRELADSQILSRTDDVEVLVRELLDLPPGAGARRQRHRRDHPAG